MNKNLLSENMLRFGTKNLNESQKRTLVLESVMETIKEHGLHNEVKRRLMEQTGPAIYDFGYRQGVSGGFAVASAPKIAYYQYTPVPGTDKKVSIYSATMAVIPVDSPDVKPINKTFYFVNGGTPARGSGVWKLKIAEMYERPADALSESDAMRYSFGGNGAVAKAIQSYKGTKGDVATKNEYGALLPNQTDWKSLFNSVATPLVGKVTLK